MDTRKSPFERSRSIGRLFAAFIAIIGLSLILVGDSGYVKNVVVFHADLAGFLANLGFTVLVFAVFQWIFDYKFREVFFRDIQAEIISNQSIRDAGIVRVYDRSKEISFSDLISKSKEIEIGVTYSDRFFKDYFGDIQKNGKLKIKVYCSDAANQTLLDGLAATTGQKAEDIKNHFVNLDAIVKQLVGVGSDITVVRLDSIPKYAFFRFDQVRTFLIPSTFVSRRANVPAIEIASPSYLHDFVQGCINVADVSGHAP